MNQFCSDIYLPLYENLKEQVFSEYKSISIEEKNHSLTFLIKSNKNFTNFIISRFSDLNKQKVN